MSEHRTIMESTLPLHMRRLLIVFLAMGGLSCSTNPVEYIPPSPLNLGFESSDGHGKPFGWYVGGGGNLIKDTSDYEGNLDTSVVHSGRYSLHLKYKSGNGFGVGAIQTDITSAVLGTRVHYSGWIKTKNISGDAGLWWRVDGRSGTVLAFNNMYDSLVNGTRDWQQYSFDIPVADSAVDVVFGVILEGTGEAWYDDLAIDTNGHPFAR
jgi:hypothetical protein